MALTTLEVYFSHIYFGGTKLNLTKSAMAYVLFLGNWISYDGQAYANRSEAK